MNTVIKEHKIAFETIKKDSQLTQLNSNVTETTTKVECKPNNGECKATSQCDYHEGTTYMWCHTNGPNYWSKCKCTNTKVENNGNPEQILANTQIQNVQNTQIVTMGIMLDDAVQKKNQIKLLLGGGTNPNQSEKSKRSLPPYVFLNALRLKNRRQKRQLMGKNLLINNGPITFASDLHITLLHLMLMSKKFYDNWM